MLEVSDIHSYYGEAHVLHGATLNVGKSEVVRCWAATAWQDQR